MNTVFFVVLLFVLLFLLNALSPKTAAKTSTNKQIVIIPMWGLCNRLRTIRVAHDLCKVLGRSLSVVDVDNDDGEFKTMFSGRLRDLFQSPLISFIDKVPQQGHKLTYNAEADCSLIKSLQDFENLDDEPIIIIEACGLVVKGLTETNSFYKSISPSVKVMERIYGVLHRVKRENVIGVHVRQGNISDYNKGNFFGKWDKDNTKPQTLPITCCRSDENKNESPCPKNAPPIEQFATKMKTFDTSSFFVCSDRPGCYDDLQQMFPGRIINNPAEIEHEAKAFNAFCDWFCLSNCSKIIVTSISSFSGEAAKMNNVEVIQL